MILIRTVRPRNPRTPLVTGSQCGQRLTEFIIADQRAQLRSEPNLLVPAMHL